MKRRIELGSFLRSRRAAANPADFELIRIGRRHVKGLRREEVAQLAGIGTSWYTLLEQGRVKTVSERTLLRIADALRVSAVERNHLIQLARNSFHQEPFHVGASEASVQFVELFDLGPALLSNAAFDIVAANALADELYHFQSGVRWNLIERILVDERLHGVFPDWENTVRNMIGVLRSNYARFGGQALDETVENLRAASGKFDELWNSHEVAALPSEVCDVNHPRFGPIQMQLHALVHAESPSHLVICLTRLRSGLA